MEYKSTRVLASLGHTGANMGHTCVDRKAGTPQAARQEAPVMSCGLITRPLRGNPDHAGTDDCQDGRDKVPQPYKAQHL